MRNTTQLLSITQNANKSLSTAEEDIMLNFISHFYDSKDKLMTLKSNTVALFASFFCQRYFFFCFLCRVVHNVTVHPVTKILHGWALQSNNPHTFVVITLDPPIRKGQTLYPHIVIQVLYCK